MAQYIVRRILWLIPVLLAVSIITFAMMHLAPGGPWDRDTSGGGRPLPQKTIDRLSEHFGLNKPIHEQYLSYMWGAVRGDLGPSYARPSYKVNELIAQRLPYSARLGLQALLLALLIGIPLGIVAAIKRNTWVDYAATFFATIGAAIPSFVLGIFLIIIFSVALGMFPVAATDWDAPSAWVLPTIALSMAPAAYIARLMRASMLEVMNQDYVRTARSKGLHERRVVVSHAVKNAMIPVWTVLGPITAGLVTGSFVVEQVFNIPGVGRFFVNAIFERDYSMIMGNALFYALIVAVGNILIDVTYVLFDPRIRVG